MNKLVCETKKARVLSVKLVCDAKADLTSARYSIQELDQSFLDAESKSSPKEILLDFEIDQDKNTANIPVFLKKQVEEFDQFKLKIFFNNNLTKTFEFFTWPDQSEDGKFSIDLEEEKVITPDDDEEEESTEAEETEQVDTEEVDTEEEDAEEEDAEEEDTEEVDTEEEDTEEVEKKSNKFYLALFCAIMVFSGIGIFLFYERFVPDKEYACFDTNTLKKASVDNETAKTHNLNCLKRFLELSENEFKNKLRNWAEEDNSLILEAGDFHNPGNLTSFLKQLRPSDKPDTLSASWYYAKAYNLDIEEAAEKLKDLCQNTEDLFDRTMIETDCDLIANE